MDRTRSEPLTSTALHDPDGLFTSKRWPISKDARPTSPRPGELASPRKFSWFKASFSKEGSPTSPRPDPVSPRTTQRSFSWKKVSASFKGSPMGNAATFARMFSWSKHPSKRSTTISRAEWTERLERAISGVAVIPIVSQPPKTFKEVASALTGKWHKDGKASDDVRPLLDLIRLGGLVRQAVKLLKGVEIRHTDETFTIAVLTKFPFYKLVERFPMNGDTTQVKRRDMRSGKQTARLVPGKLGSNGGVLFDLYWGEPFAGTCVEEFALALKGTAANEKGSARLPADIDYELHIYSNFTVEGKEVRIRTVYYKAG